MSALPIRILHLEDSSVDHQLVVRSLQRSGMDFTIERVETLQAFAQAFAQAVSGGKPGNESGTESAAASDAESGAEFDVILADYALHGFTALDAWHLVNRPPGAQPNPLARPPVQPTPPFVLLSGAIGEAAAVAAIQLGMSDYLLKDDMAGLAQVIRRAIEVHRARMATDAAHAELARSERRLADFAEHLQTTIEQERAAIAREIHDDIGGSLAAIKFDLAWVGRHTADAPTLAHVDSASQMLQHAIGASQRIMMNLRPAILDQGLGPALDWLCSGFERRTSIKTTLLAPPLRPGIAKAIELTAYRCAQEALTNISKYAQCDHVSVEVSDAEGVLTLEVSDNGCGMAPTDADKPQSYGLRGLAERAKTVGGWLDVSVRSPHGTSIILSIPLADSLLNQAEGAS